MSAILVKMPPAIRSAAAPRDSPIAKPMKQAPAISGGQEQQDDEHHQQLEADQHHADRHAGLQRDAVHRQRPAAQRGERGARVGEGVDPDAEPRHRVGAAHAEEAERQDDRDPLPREPDEHPVVDDDHRGDERPQDQQEPALLEQVGLARGVDQLGDLAHRQVHGHRLQLQVDQHPEAEAERAHEQAEHQQRRDRSRRRRR